MKSRWLLIAYAICARNFLHFYRFLQHYLKTDDWMFVVSTRDLPLTSKRQSSFKVQSVLFFCSSVGDLLTLTATNFVNLHKIAFWISIKFKKELNGPLTTMHLLVFGLLTIPRGTWALHHHACRRIGQLSVGSVKSNPRRLCRGKEINKRENFVLDLVTIIFHRDTASPWNN